MSFLYCVRHSQASAHAEDYDQLSELGYEQSALLGKRLATMLPTIDHVWYGPRKRHHQTYVSSKQPDWPTPVLKEWLDEFPAHEIMEKGLPTLRGTHLESHIEIINNQVGTGSPEFLTVLQYLCDQWVSERLILDDVESGAQYKHRIKNGIQEVQEVLARGESIILFSSAGAISTLFGTTLKADPVHSLHIAWAMYNTSITTLRHFHGGLINCSLNWIDHIPLSKRTFV